jgi:hypothetical protein
MRRVLIVFLVALALVAIVYRRVPINFFRAESGTFLSLSHSSAEIQQQRVKIFFTTSYGGHYTPLAFLAEFQCAKIAGPARWFWRWRQLFVLALVGAGLFVAAQSIGAVYQLSAVQGSAAATAISAGAIFQAQMVDLVSWPFMILQLIWAGFLVFALYAVVRLAVSANKTRWAWTATMTAYASMHISGVGLVVVCAVAVVTAIFLVGSIRLRAGFHDHRRGMMAALGTMLSLAAAHTWAMVFLQPASNVSLAPQPNFFVAAAKLFLGFVNDLALAGLRTFAAASYAETNSVSIAYSWPYGLLVIAGLVATFCFLLRAAMRNPTPQSLVTFALHAFSIVAFFTVVFMMSARLLRLGSLREAASNLAYFTYSPRYVVQLHFLLIASAAHLVIKLIGRTRGIAVGVSFAVGVAALLAQTEYQASAYPLLAPLSRIEHSVAWKLIVDTARECRSAQLPIPNVPLGALTQEFADLDARMFEPLLRQELHLAAGENIEIVPWDQYLAADRKRYQAAVPSLAALEQKLGVAER